MTDKNIDAQEVQQKLAKKFNLITVRKLAIESFEEQVEEFIDDLLHIYEECGTRKTKAEVKILVDVYVDEEKARKEEEAKIEKSTLKMKKMEAAKEELSVLDRFKLQNYYDEADALHDTVPDGVFGWGVCAEATKGD